MRTISEISHHLVSLEETLRNRFIPAITSGHICNDTERKLLFLPTRFGGLAIPIFYDQASAEYSNSRKLTVQLAPLLKNQVHQYTVHETQIKINKQVIKKRKVRSTPHQLRLIKKYSIREIEKITWCKHREGVSNWLTALSISDFGFELSKQHFWDAIHLRYGWSIANLPTTCPCGSRFSIQVVKKAISYL